MEIMKAKPKRKGIPGLLQWIPEGEENARSLEMLMTLTDWGERAVRLEIKRLREQEHEMILSSTEKAGSWKPRADEYANVERYKRMMASCALSSWGAVKAACKWQVAARSACAAKMRRNDSAGQAPDESIKSDGDPAGIKRSASSGEHAPGQINIIKDRPDTAMSEAANANITINNIRQERVYVNGK